MNQDGAAGSAFVDGVRAVSPLLVGVIPFGLILGVAAGGSVMGAGLAWATSPIIFGGAAQLVTIELTNAGTASLVVIATALIVNARHFMYSAALAEHFRPFPPIWRLALPYLMTDQAFAVSIIRYGSVDDASYKRWFFLGAGLALWVPWQLTTAIGAVVGASVPASWSLDFSIPLVFMALLIPALGQRAGVAAAAVGGAVSVAALNAPYRLGLIIATLAGVTAAVLVEGGRR